MNRYLFLMIFCFLFFFLVDFASAFAVSTLYSDNYPLEMLPGESKETFFLLSNVVEGDSDAVIKSDLVGGNEIAQLIDLSTVYNVPNGRELEVPVRLHIPSNAEVGHEYKVSAIFRPSNSNAAGGNIQFIVNIVKSFPVVVVGEKKEPFKGESVSFTVEEEEDLVNKLAPSFKGGKGIFFFLLFFFLLAIIVVLIIIILLLKGRIAENTETAVNDIIQTES